MHSRFRCLGKLGLFLVILIAFVPRPAVGLIMGGKRNKLVKDPGWPEGAEAIFNNRGRIAYWVADGIEGWHADCRGDAEALSAVLADYAKLDVEPKRVVVCTTGWATAICSIPLAWRRPTRGRSGLSWCS
jgi:hypothetical protein